MKINFKKIQLPLNQVLAALPLTASLMLTFTTSAEAQPLFANLYKQQYGYTPACIACHRDGGGSVLNSYGEEFKKAGESAAAFKAVADKDSDGDGFANAVEAMAKANPGKKDSTPKDKGQWLDISSLIPKEVQDQFPAVKEYLPRDAILTEQDISRAKSMGAVLSNADINTIYIPLVDRKPAGTGLIFQGEFKGKPFFLMMTTDRNLNITKVAPVNTRQVEAAAKATVYKTFEGVALDKLPEGKGDDLNSAITKAVKKAGTLVFVRLKSA